MRTWVLATACLLALAIGAVNQPAPGVQAPADEPRVRAGDTRGVLAVMRRDGLMVPFAAYKGTKWTAPWPMGTRNLELPIDMESIPHDWWGGEPPERWKLYLADGVTKNVSPVRPRTFRSFCNTRVGLATDYGSSEPVPVLPADPYPKDGLVSSAELDLTPIESVDRAAPELARLAQTLARDFDKAEEKTLDLIRGREGWRHPVKLTDRKATPVTIEAWYRAPMDEPGWTASYIEAVRAYPPGPEDDGCGLQTVFTGWMHSHADDPKKTRVQLTARAAYCDRRGVNYMLPFGVFHAGHQQYWAYQLSGFDQEWYEVARMTPLKMSFVVEAFGGRGHEACGFPGAPPL